jgi:thiol-disulfide isomerase/thioredoxin
MPNMKMLMLFMIMADEAASTKPEIQLLDFGASYCQPCQQMVPILQSMAKVGFPVRQIDITEEHELARRYRIDRIPTLVLLVEGREVKRFIGLTDEAELRQAMNVAARKLAEERGQRAAQTVNVVSDEASTKSDPQTPSAAETEVPAVASEKRPSIREVLQGVLSGGKQTTSFEFPEVRAQSPDSAGSLVDKLTLAANATTRVRVGGTRQKDGATVEDVGTGTIIYSAVGQSIVLTCAHLFLELKRDGTQVEVEVFEGGKSTSYKGEIIGGSHDSDLALIKIRSSKLLPFVRVSFDSPEVKRGQQLISFGCNNGADPTRLDTKVVDINRYNGPANLTCSTDPQSGRSGGGLFALDGTLVGVCSCADRKNLQGLYMAHTPVVELLRRTQMQSILLSPSANSGDDAAKVFAEMREGTTADATPMVADSQVDPSSKEQAQTEDPLFDPLMENENPFKEIVAVADKETALSDAPEFVPNEPQSPGDADTLTASAMATKGDAEGTELRIEIRDKTPGSRPRVIVIPKASPWMLELLTGETTVPVDETTTVALRPKADHATAMGSRKNLRTAAVYSAP